MLVVVLDALALLAPAVGARLSQQMVPPHEIDRSRSSDSTGNGPAALHDTNSFTLLGLGASSGFTVRAAAECYDTQPMASIRPLNASSCVRPPEAVLQPALALMSAVHFAGCVLTGFTVHAAADCYDTQPMVCTLLNACSCVRPPEAVLSSTPLGHNVGHIVLQAQKSPRACSRASGSPQI